MKLKKPNDSQQKALADIFEKIGLGTGMAVFINAVVLDKPTVNTIEMIIISIVSIILLTLSILWRK